MRWRRSLVSALVVLAALSPGWPSELAAVEVGPDAEWCAILNTLGVGQELLLRGGDYAGPCTIRHGGTADAPVVIRAKDPAQRPRIVYAGRDSNVLNVRAGHIVIRGLRLGPTQPDVDGIRIYRGDAVTVEECRFEDLGGIAVVANSTNVRWLTVRRNEILRSRSTAMYFGCHNGLSCALTDLLVEENYIDGVTSDAVGYGIQVKLNSSGVLRDNVIVDTKGPGIMVYGAHDRGVISVIERNFVARSRSSSAIVLGGGSAIVRNNIAVSSAEGGIGLENYGRRDLLRGIVVVHNTIHGNAKGGILAPANGRLEATIINNAAAAAPGTAVFPFGRLGVLSLGNFDCSLISCFLNPHERDFSLLAPRRGLLFGESWMPADDYFGRARGVPPTVGAVEEPVGPIPLGPKRGVP